VDKTPLWKRGVRGDLKGKVLRVLRYSKSLKKCSRSLRVNMTEAEKLLWEKIRGKQLKGFQFYRQKTIGNYIVDFYCPKAKLVMELDGGQHYSSEGKAKDRERDGYMKGIGLRVLRFSDKEVFNNTQDVLERIWGICDS
jgi:very-short-patch-repair endonuclease